MTDFIAVPKLQALPGRVIMEFDPPEEQRGGIFIPEKSKRLSEVGRVISIGDPLDEAQAKIRANIHEGDRIPVTYGAGVSWYFGGYEDKFSPVRAFSLSELAAKVVE